MTANHCPTIMESPALRKMPSNSSVKICLLLIKKNKKTKKKNQNYYSNKINIVFLLKERENVYLLQL